MCCTRPTAAASHHAGLAIHGLPIAGVDLARIDLVADVAHASTRSGVRTRPMPPGERILPVEGVRVASVATCLVQTTAESGLLAGLVSADAALHDGLVDRAELAAAAVRLAPRRGAGSVRTALWLVDPRAESPGETRTRLMLVSAGLAFVSQAQIVDGTGRFLARVDFLVAGRVVVEFDGAVTYAGADGREGLVREKRREDALRALDYEVVRLSWADLDRPELVLARIHEALARAGARVSGTRTSAWWAPARSGRDGACALPRSRSGSTRWFFLTSPDIQRLDEGTASRAATRRGRASPRGGTAYRVGWRQPLCGTRW